MVNGPFFSSPVTSLSKKKSHPKLPSKQWLAKINTLASFSKDMTCFPTNETFSVHTWLTLNISLSSLALVAGFSVTAVSVSPKSSPFGNSSLGLPSRLKKFLVLKPKKLPTSFAQYINHISALSRFCCCTWVDTFMKYKGYNILMCSLVGMNIWPSSKLHYG